MRPERPSDTETIGYSVRDLEDYLTAADARADELRAAIADARARQRALHASDATEVRARIADAWMTAHLEAETIRATADHDAQEIIAAAEREAATLQPAMAAKPTGLDLLRTSLEGRDDLDPSEPRQ